MKLKTSLRAAAATSLVLGLGVTASAVAAGAATRTRDFQPQQENHALFVESESASGNRVLAYNRASDGTISFAGSYATGGFGSTAAGATADPIASQGGLTLINNGNELVATNSGSDTVTVFAVQGSHLTFVQQVGSQGQFPVSVASNGNSVAVLNAGSTGSVVQFRLLGGFLSPFNPQVRSLGLTNTTPPDFHHGAGEVAYSPNGKFLIVNTKASTNSFEVFPVGFNGNLAATAKVTAADNGLPFAFVFDSAGNIVSAEASPSSVSTYSINSDGSLTSLGTVPDGQVALCWISGANGYFFGSNAGSGNVSSFDESSTGAPQLVNATAATAHGGTIDSAVSPDGQFLYVESGGAGTIDAYGIGAGGTLTQIETIFNVPPASEGIAVS
ncbi:MAG: beta-propeller fold lactonase family protein [Acidimicrobiales bacterium]